MSGFLKLAAVCTGCYLRFAQASIFAEWIGVIGWVIGAALVPLVPLFPLVVWVVDGAMPVNLLIAEAVLFGSAIIATVLRA